MPGDQFDYNAAIAESQRQQLLVNLVRLRYHETPVFLTVASMISTYSRVASVGAEIGANTGTAGENTAGAGANLLWTDRPTITYVPLSGQEFAENLLQPLPPRDLFGLMLAGWPATLVMRVSLWSLNDLDNEIARPSRRRHADPELNELFEVWHRLREAGAIGVREAKSEQGPGQLVMFLRDDLPADKGLTEAQRLEVERDAQRFCDLLSLDRSARVFRLTYGRVPEDRSEIAVLTGSIWDIMLNLAWQLDIPEEHIASGRTGPTFVPSDDDLSPRVRVRFSKEKPSDAFVAIEAQGYWFYIHQDDSQSKRTFSFLQLLLNLSETATPDRSPLVTISG